MSGHVAAMISGVHAVTDVAAETRAVTVPTKWQLAVHWSVSIERGKFAPMLQDLAEPRCFACGWYSERWLKPTARSGWEKATLERAHIVPSSLGGRNDASNVILLCKPCHEESPDWHDANEMASWIAGRDERGSKELEEFSRWCAAAQHVPEFEALCAEYAANPDVPYDAALRRVRDATRDSARNATTHGTKISDSTMIAILRDVAAKSTIDGAVSI